MFFSPSYGRQFCINVIDAIGAIDATYRTTASQTSNTHHTQQDFSAGKDRFYLNNFRKKNISQGIFIQKKPYLGGREI